MTRRSKTAAKPATPSATPQPRAAATEKGGSTGRSSNKVAKAQMIEEIAARTSLNRKQATEAVTVLLDGMVQALREGHSVGLPGLGTFSVVPTAERQGVRPGTGERIIISAGKKIRFKVATTLKGTL